MYFQILIARSAPAAAIIVSPDYYSILQIVLIEFDPFAEVGPFRYES
jgi:hypothetical protein